MVSEFFDASAHAFYDTGRSHEALVARPRDSYDSATPSGTSVACDVLVRLGHLTGNPNYALIADDVLSGLAEHAAKSAHGYARLLCAADLAVGPVAEVAIIGDPQADDTRTFSMHCAPSTCHARSSPSRIQTMTTLWRPSRCWPIAPRSTAKPQPTSA